MVDFLYAGQVKHRRYAPIEHSFAYNIFMFYFPLDNIAQTFINFKFFSMEKFNWFTFKRNNYFTDNNETLDAALRTYIQNQKGVRPTGKIYLLTQLSCLGYCFNPISVYFVLKEQTKQIEYVVAEVTNTPWGERHLYLLDNPIIKNNLYLYRFKKQLHVSPFMSMNYEYQFNLKHSDNKIIIHMQSFQNDTKHFDATLSLQLFNETKQSLKQYFLNNTWMTYKITFLIYWEALKLWLKGVQFHTHPKKFRP